MIRNGIAVFNLIRRYGAQDSIAHALCSQLRSFRASYWTLVGHTRGKKRNNDALVSPFIERRQDDKVARELGVGTGTVQRIAREMGGPFDAAAA